MARQRPVRSRVRHGMASCADYGCKLPECLRARQRAIKGRKFRAAHGIRSTVDASPAAAHLHRLVAAELSIRDIAARTGLSRATLHDVAGGKRDQVQRETAEAILAIPLPQRGAAPSINGWISATGARRRLQALSVRGFPMEALAREIDRNRKTLEEIRAGKRPRLTMALNRAITQACERLWNADPVDHGVSPHGAAAARRYAAQQGWAPLAAWDEERITNPRAKPRGVLRLAA